MHVMIDNVVLMIACTPDLVFIGCIYIHVHCTGCWLMASCTCGVHCYCIQCIDYLLTYLNDMSVNLMMSLYLSRTSELSLHQESMKYCYCIVFVLCLYCIKVLSQCHFKEASQLIYIYCVYDQLPEADVMMRWLESTQVIVLNDTLNSATPNLAHFMGFGKLPYYGGGCSIFVLIVRFYCRLY